jgi:hypothetical protein
MSPVTEFGYSFFAILITVALWSSYSLQSQKICSSVCSPSPHSQFNRGRHLVTANATIQNELSRQLSWWNTLTLCMSWLDRYWTMSQFVRPLSTVISPLWSCQHRPSNLGPTCQYWQCPIIHDQHLHIRLFTWRLTLNNEPCSLSRGNNIKINTNSGFFRKLTTVWILQ